MAKVKSYHNKKAKSSKTLQKQQKEVNLEDIYVALADFIIDSYLENKKVVNLNRTQHNRKSL